jgi:lysozyme family protein
MTDDDPGDADNAIPREPNGHILTELARTRERQSGGHGQPATPAMRGAIGSFDYLMWSVGLSEGGYANKPHDKGGETNYGITAPFAAAYAKATHQPVTPIRHWTLKMARDAYRVLIWEGPWVRCREVSAIAPVTGFVYGDGCVNHAMRNMVKMLQREVGVTPDGLCGPQTLDALLTATTRRSDVRVATGLLLRRRDYYLMLVDMDATQARWLHGWRNRLNEVADRADLTWRWT